jgi:hypothetical protein
MATTTMGSNGRSQRKSLADQIDRLDTILDGLAEALDGSVAEAVKGAVTQAVGEAVRLAVKEVLSSPELLRMALSRHEPAQEKEEVEEPPRGPGVLGWCAEKARQGCRKLGGGWRSAAERRATIKESLAKVACGVWQSRRYLAAGLATGLGCAVVCLYGGPAVAATVSAVSGAALTVAGMILMPLRRLLLASHPNHT